MRNSFKHKWQKIAAVIIYLLIALIFPIVNALLVSSILLNISAPSDIDTFSKNYITSLKKGDAEALKPITDPQLQLNEENVASFKSLLSTVDLESVKTMGFNKSEEHSDGHIKTQYQVVYEFHNNNDAAKFVNVSTVVNGTDGNLSLVGIKLHGTQESIGVIQSINFQQYWRFILLFITVPLLLAAVGMKYIYTASSPKWKILAMILLGTIFISLTQTSKDVYFNFLLGIGGQLTSYSIPIPIGLLIYLMKKEQFDR